jgi:hypothetical protein
VARANVSGKRVLGKIGSGCFQRGVHLAQAPGPEPGYREQLPLVLLHEGPDVVDARRTEYAKRAVTEPEGIEVRHRAPL